MTIQTNFPSLGDGNKTKRLYEPTYTKNENQVKGRCQLILDGHICNAKVSARGLCGTHYHRFLHNDDKSLLKKYGTLHKARGRFSK